LVLIYVTPCWLNRLNHEQPGPTRPIERIPPEVDRIVAKAFQKLKEIHGVCRHTTAENHFALYDGGYMPALLVQVDPHKNRFTCRDKLLIITHRSLLWLKVFLVSFILTIFKPLTKSEALFFLIPLAWPSTVPGGFCQGRAQRAARVALTGSAGLLLSTCRDEFLIPH